MDFDKEDDASRSVWRNKYFKYYSEIKMAVSVRLILVRKQINKSVYHNIISALKRQHRYDYQKYFRMNSETSELS